ncbi:MAG TPA: Glu-tRNA(Gln) amidotransferase subunit GatE [Candidatus Nanoarchaeia archaeon]|nr:Glu-tRNA(Gln) amidotransferase subunit GatE [Candidatus Nanoarchaeia archaeon]
MSIKDWGLKCGIEIHQQLEGKKLFCHCPTLLREDKADFTIERKLRASAGEGGKIDVAAQAEQAKGKSFVYEGYYDSTCLVELDEEPPHELNQEALHTALQFSLLAQSTISPIIQVMRKTVVDGSNTSGFQRTALVARHGQIDTSEGTVRLMNISLEEDSAKIITEKQVTKTYRLDRLGIPLIEIGTEADIVSAQQCQEAAKKIGLLLRSLPGVKRGLGTIRQDVNVSIKGGTRIEIKGAQDLHQLPTLVEFEAKRQHELLKLKEELKNVKLDKLNVHDLTTALQQSTSKILSKTIQTGGKILGIKLNGLAGYLGKELVPHYRLGTECAGRAKIKAGVGGIFHSDELPNYGITDVDVEFIKKELHCTPKDAFVLVADEEARATVALEAVHERLQELWHGIPSEVRKANSDGTTSYLRPMPGAARMYPETDVPLIVPSTKSITLPETIEHKTARYQQELGLGKDLADYIAKSEKVFLFEEMVQAHPDIKPAFIAETLTSTLLDIKRQYHHDPDVLTDENFKAVFEYLAHHKIHKDIVLDVLIDMITGQFDLGKYVSLGTEKIHTILKEIVAKNKSAPFPALMGLAMKELQGKASGKFISEQLKKMVENGH